MIKTKSLLILISTLLFSNYYLSFSEELTITTYYPSPVGIYKELRAKRMAIGDNYYNPSDYSWGSEILSDADLVVEGRIGIGTTDPLEKLDVNGGIRVDDYIKARDSGGLSLKTDDGTTRLFIKDNGNVGIGTTNPGKKLEVAGSTKIGGDLNVNGDTQLGDSSSDKTTVKGDLEISGGLRLGNYATKPACNASVKGLLVFDTTNDKPYVCTSTGWRPLDSASEVITVIDRCLVADDVSLHAASCTATATCPSGYKVVKCYGGGRGDRRSIGTGSCEPVIASVSRDFFQGDYPLSEITPISHDSCAYTQSFSHPYGCSDCCIVVMGESIAVCIKE